MQILFVSFTNKYRYYCKKITNEILQFLKYKKLVGHRLKVTELAPGLFNSRCALQVYSKADGEFRICRHAYALNLLKTESLSTDLRGTRFTRFYLNEVKPNVFFNFY